MDAGPRPSAYPAHGYSITPQDARQRAEAFRADYSGSVKSMMKMLFHEDADPALIAEAERRMQKTSPVAAYAMFMSLAGYDQAASAGKLSVSLRAINGDLYPTDVPAVRKTKADFDVVVMKHTGHYPDLSISVQTPAYKATNPITGEDLEGTGVKPDIAVSAEQELDLACKEAAAELLASESRDASKQTRPSAHTVFATRS